MPVVIVNYPEPETGCNCSACKWLREAHRNDRKGWDDGRYPKGWNKRD